MSLDDSLCKDLDEWMATRPICDLYRHPSLLSIMNMYQ